MHTCAACGEPLALTDRRCPSCGTEVADAQRSVAVPTGPGVHTVGTTNIKGKSKVRTVVRGIVSAVIIIVVLAAATLAGIAIKNARDEPADNSVALYKCLDVHLKGYTPVGDPIPDLAKTVRTSCDHKPAYVFAKERVPTGETGTAVCKKSATKHQAELTKRAVVYEVGAIERPGSLIAYCYMDPDRG